MAKIFHKELVELKNEVVKMGNLALKMLDDSMRALTSQDIKLAKKTIDKKTLLKRYDSEIEAKALRLIALYQPMAMDLRLLATILKIITYLTRLGRYGKDIAVIVEELSTKPYPASFINLKHMWEHVKTMAKDSFKAFEESDINYIKNFGERDNEVDEMRWSIFRESITYIMEDSKVITPCLFFAMIARYLERCGDNTCKIAEKVYYMVTGEHIEIK